MLGVAEARARILEGVLALPAEIVALNQARGRVLAADVRSPESLPPFDNSAMDGYALHLGGQLATAGSEFAVRGLLAAGDAPAHDGIACAIMTGAPLPPGLDSVVPVEQVEALAHDEQGETVRIRLRSALDPAANVRYAGEDIRAGEAALSAGTRLGAAQQMLLAGIGVGQLAVRRQPRVALICTGRELLDDPTLPLAAGQVRNSNAPYLRARVEEAGALLLSCRTIADDPGEFAATVAEAMAAGADLVLSTGAVSMGRYDFVPDSLRALGARIEFHKLRMRPGKPLLYARLPDGAAYLGLPGNPASSAVGMRFFAEALLRALLGLPAERPLRLPLAGSARKKAGLTLLQKAAVALDTQACLHVGLLPGQESFKVRPLAAANAWVVLPEEASELSAGTPVEVHGLSHWGLLLEH